MILWEDFSSISFFAEINIQLCFNFQYSLDLNFIHLFTYLIKKDQNVNFSN